LGLPGSQVRVLLLPWTTGHFGTDGLYVPTPNDVPAFSHICALRGAGFPHAAPVDSPVLLAAVAFIVCDLEHIIRPGLLRTEETARVCALQAGFEWDGALGIKTCTEGGPGSMGYSLMHSSGYSSRILAAMRWPGAPAVTTPFVYLDEQMLYCPGPAYCSELYTASGPKPLPSEGSLGKVICTRLHPVPAACQSLVAPAGPTTVSTKFAKHCEDCEEVLGTALHWRHGSGGGTSRSAWLVPLLLVAAVAGLGVLTVLRHKWNQSSPSFLQAEAME